MCAQGLSEAPLTCWDLWRWQIQTVPKQVPLVVSEAGAWAPYQLDPMTGGTGDGPGTLLLAGVSVWPVGAGEGPAGRRHLVVTTGCRGVSEGSGRSVVPQGRAPVV